MSEPTAPGYTGPASLVVGGTELVVRVTLRGHFEPIDGRYHWYGRIANHPPLAAILRGRNATGELRTPLGAAGCRLSDVDTWGRYRVAGTSTPPFTVNLPDPPNRMVSR